MILLSILAVYDAISVYKTKHMLSLAEGVTKMRLPVLFYVPKKLDFKVEQMDNMDLKNRDKDVERETMIMGVGDAVIPGILDRVGHGVSSNQLRTHFLMRTSWSQPEP